MSAWSVRYSRHALRRMLDWDLSVDDVAAVIDTGETIEEYEDDNSRLVLGRSGIRPIHAVVADREAEWIRMVVTVYEPDPARWQPDFRERRRP